MLGADDVAELSEAEREARDVKDRAEWYDEHDWTEMAEREWERYRALKSGEES